MPPTQGNALVLSGEALDAPIGSESHESRIIKASFRTKEKRITMNFTQFYAPSSDNKRKMKIGFMRDYSWS